MLGSGESCEGGGSVSTNPTAVVLLRLENSIEEGAGLLVS